MSLPLPARRRPIYPVTNSLGLAPLQSYSTSTYCREECWCGCAEYLEDAAA
jgi:hypothetical protein